jgi:Bacteriophage peptidoglycan hydrolase
MNPQLAAALLRNRTIRGWLVGGGLLVIVVPVLVAAAITALVAQESEAGCGDGGEAINQPAGGGVLASGVYAAPLTVQPGRSYKVGATEYGGPGDPTSGQQGSIPTPGQSFLPAHPDSFAELSVLHSNPANHGSFTFTDANALNRLPYLTALRVTHDGRRALLFKRDIGYGQGPGQLIGNGQPYRIDVWWQAAKPLGVTKSAVRIALAPATGAAGTLEQLPSSSEATPGGEAGASCPALQAVTGVPLPLMPGTATRILPSGLAAAGSQAPAPVRAMVAAGNRLFAATYLYGGAHGASLNTLEPAYDCSSAVSYLLHAGGVLGSGALDSTELTHYGLPGPGRYVSIYANEAHTFIYVAGLRFDTVEDPAYDSGPNSGKPGPRWRVSPTVPAWAAWTVRHPAGL